MYTYISTHVSLSLFLSYMYIYVYIHMAFPIPATAYQGLFDHMEAKYWSSDTMGLPKSSGW